MRLLIFLILPLFTHLYDDDTWVHSDYDEYTVKTFFLRDDVNQPINKDNFDPKLMEAAVHYASNETRIKKRKTEFSFDEKLMQAATLHSGNMLKYNFFDHTYRKDRRLRSPKDRIESVGGEFNFMAENIALMNVLGLGHDGKYYVNQKGELVDSRREPLVPYTYAELARKTLKMWMKSKGHRKNLMDEFEYLGVGVSKLSITKDGLPEVYITQNFGSK